MIFLGIDPGLDGYLVALGETNELAMFPCPLVDVSKGGKRRYDLPGTLSILRCDLRLPALARSDRQEAFCLIEKQQAFPKQGGVSNFSTGWGYGLWRMALTACEVPHEEIHPATWKKRLGLKGTGDTPPARKKDSKRRAIEKAQALFPGVDLRRTPRCRTPSADMAEALLLAWLARQTIRG